MTSPQYAAQLGQRAPRRPAAAIDDASLARPHVIGVNAKARLATQRGKPLQQPRQRRARIEMAFVRKEQALANPPRKLRLERADPIRIERLMAPRRARESRKIWRVAWRGDHQSAGSRNGGAMRLPPVERRSAKPDDVLRRAFALAMGRQHAAGDPRAGALAKRSAALDKHRRDAARLQRHRRRQSADPGADDESCCHRCLVSAGGRSQASLRPS